MSGAISDKSGKDSGNTALQQALGRLNFTPRPLEPGHVWLAGAGPGDPGCLTLEVLAALAEADALVYDALVSPDVVAVAANAELFYAGKRGGQPSMKQEDITALLVRLAREGRRVVRLKGGDPYIFGRGGEEALALLQAAADFGVDVDAVVLDYRAQGMSGADIARAIRREPRFDDLAIIFLTSMDAVGDDDFFSALKVQAHLMKPARAKVLRNAIVDAVRAARIRRLSAAPDRPAITSTVSAGVASAAAQSQAGGLDVLVAEDNEVNCIVFSQILQGLDLRFLIVNDGQQALEAWREHKPGVILMDVSMPVMNGHQATRAIRAHEGAAIARGETVEPVPIVGVTAHAHAADRDLCFQSGMNDYLSKPLSPEMLEEKIGRWLPRKAKASSTN